MLRMFAATAALLASAFAVAQPAPPTVDWKDWRPMLGDWEADAAGPTAPTGGYSLTADLQGRVLVRKNHAQYPKSGDRPASTHDDLMVIYRDGAATRADYWDSEGHLIHYAVTIDKGKSFTFLSDGAPGQPRFRLTYTLTGAATVSLRFEIAPPNAPDQFKPYIQATAHRKR